uniref:Genome polyprotein n=1 Tax=Army ant associated picorna-like virus 1 TaxID=3004038 RepID=A0A9Y1HU96_9VIRU|nr:MAG: polyprotein [Army ant associated picorna-like virus 1]
MSSQNAIIQQTQNTSLMPERVNQRQSGPTAFVMGNSFGSRPNFRSGTNETAAQAVAFPEVDLPFLINRPHQIKTTTWTTSQDVDDLLFSVSGADMNVVSTLKTILGYQVLYRYDPVLEVTLSASATAVGAIVVYWVPYDLSVGGTPPFTSSRCLMFNHEIIQPYKQASGTVKGFFQRPYRFNVSGISDVGTFYCQVYNKLGGASTTAAANSITVTAFVNFVKFSARVPTSPKAATFDLLHMSEKQKRELMKQLEDDVERKGVLAGEDEKTVSSSVDTQIVEQTKQPVVMVDTDTVEEKATDFGRVPPRNVLGGHQTQYAGFLTTSHDDLKLSLQRFGRLITIPAVAKNKFPITTLTEVLFSMTLEDLVKCITPTLMYYCWSGGVRLKWVHNADVLVDAVLSVTTLGGTQYFHLRDHTEQTIVIPYWCMFSARPSYPNTNSFPSDDVIQFVTVSLVGNVGVAFQITFFLSTADDFVVQSPIPKGRDDFAALKWRVAPVLYEGVAPASQDTDVVRKGLADVINDVESFATGVVSTVASAARGVAGVVDTVAGFASDAGAVLGLFDKPDAFAENEWNVVDHAVPVVRMQYASTDYVKHDETVSCDNRGIEMMKLSKLLQIPLRKQKVTWTTADDQGKQLTTLAAGLVSMEMWGLISDFCPRLWRGTTRLRFEVVKNVFHKGVIVAVFAHVGSEVPTMTTYTDYYNVVFDISRGDSFEMDIPYSGQADYLAKTNYPGSIFLFVVNKLVAQGTTTSVEINVITSMGPDLELRVPLTADVMLANLALTYKRTGPYAPAPSQGKTIKVGTPIVSSDEEFEDLGEVIRKGDVEESEEFTQTETNQFKILRMNGNRKIKRTYSDTDFLVSCGLRNELRGELMLCNGREKVKAIVVCKEELDHCHLHVHTDDTCFRLSCPAGVPQGYLLDSVSKLVSSEKKIPTVVVPIRQKTSHVTAKVRFLSDNKHRYVVCKIGGSLVKANVTGHHVWDVVHTLQTQDFPIERKGGLVTKMGEQFGDGVKQSLNSEVDVQGLVDDVKSKVRQTVDDVDENGMSLIFGLAATKLPAYLFQASSISDWKGIVAIVLHLLGDMLIVYKAHELLRRLISGLIAKVQDIVLAVVTPVFKDDSDGYLKSVWKIVKGVIRPLCAKAWSSFESFSRIMKPFSLLGSATKGLTTIVEFFKSILEWFGLCFSSKKRELKRVKKWLEQNAEVVESDLAEMKAFITTGNIHSLSTDELAFRKIKSLGTRAMDYKQKMMSVWNEPGCRGNADIITRFLNKMQELPNDPLGNDGFEPVFVLLEGPPGMGKSVLSVKLARTFSKILSDDSDRFYRASIGADFWTGCADQQVMVIDDLFQDPSGEGVSMLTQLISTVGCPLPKADIAGKFGMSQAKIVIGSSNSKSPTVGSLTCPSALVRRYKNTHYSAVSMGVFKKVHHGEDGIMTYGPELTENEVCCEIQRHFLGKWKRHLQMQNAKPLRIISELKKEMQHVRKRAVQVHAEQVGTCKTKESSDSSDEQEYETDDEQTTVVRKGAVFELIQPEPENRSKFFKSVIEMSPRDLPSYLTAKVKGSVVEMSGEQLRMHYLDVPYGVTYVGNGRVYENINSDFADWKMKVDYLDPRCRFVLAIAYTYNLDCNVVLAEIRKNSSKTFGGRVMEWLEAICLTITYTTTAVTCLCVAGILVTSIVMMYVASGDPEPKGAYDTRPQSRTAGRNVRVEYPATRQGYIESRPVIEKSILKWTVVNPRGQKISVHCLSVGQGYVLVNSHAIYVGMQHFITYNESGYQRIVPVHVSENTKMEFVCGEGTVLDLCLVWIGSTIPLRKGIVNHFVSAAQMEMLTEVDSVVLLDRGQVVETRARMKWTEKMRVRKSNLGDEIMQKCFAGPVYLEGGDCGSPVVVSGGAMDGKIFGVASAGSVTKGIFLPVTRESLLDGMAELGAVVGDTTLCVEDSSVVEMLGSVVEDVGSKVFPITDWSPEIPVENPQFLPIKSDERSHVSVTTKIIKNDRLIDAPFAPEKDIAINNMRKSDTRLNVSGSWCDATIFENKIPDSNFDSIKLEAALDVVEAIYKQFVSPCRLYTEAEILNRVSQADVENDILEESNPINATSAAGHKLDEEYGKHPRGYYVVEDKVTKSRVYSDELRQEVETLESSLRSGVMPQNIVEMHYKDELRSKEKTSKGRCRLFYVADLAVWCLQKKYFGHFITKYRAGHGFLGKHSIGCDPVKYWNSWGQEFAKRKMICGDVSGWDTSVTGWHIDFVRRLIEEFYPESTTEDRLVRKLLMDGAIWTHCVFDKFNFIVSGLKSGMFATTEFNSILHTLVICYALDGLITREEIVDWPFLVCGDDSAVSAPVETEKAVSQYEKCYSELGFKLTGSDKGEVKLSEVHKSSFLKRKFKQLQVATGKFYVPKIERETVRALLDFRRKGVEFGENWRNALIFCRQGWDVAMFCYVQHVGVLKEGFAVPSWEEVGQWYEPHRDEILILESPKWWEEKYLRRAAWVMWVERFKFRELTRIKPDLDELVWLTVHDVLMSFWIADEFSCEHPVFLYMRRQLEKHNIFVVREKRMLCVIWWFFCYFDFDEKDWEALVRQVPPRITQEMKQLQVDEFLKHPIFPVPKGNVNAQMDTLVRKFPQSDSITYMAIYHVVILMTRDPPETVSYVARVFKDLGMDPVPTGDNLFYTEINDEYRNNPYRLDVDQCVVTDENPFVVDELNGRPNPLIPDEQLNSRALKMKAWYGTYSDQADPSRSEYLFNDLEDIELDNGGYDEFQARMLGIELEELDHRYAIAALADRQVDDPGEEGAVGGIVPLPLNVLVEEPVDVAAAVLNQPNFVDQVFQMQERFDDEYRYNNNRTPDFVVDGQNFWYEGDSD